MGWTSEELFNSQQG